MKLDLQDFRNLIRVGSLFAFDFIAADAGGKILLGKRRNPPGRGFWFVPGGRVFKNETLREGLMRLGSEELGMPLTPEEIVPLGLYDHLYPDNFLGEEGITTHYIVLACRVLPVVDTARLPHEQHEEYTFRSPEHLIKDDDVHPFTRYYFIPDPPNLFWRARG